MDRSKIVAEYIRGKRVSDLSKEYGVTRERIYQILREDPLFDVYKKKHFCARRKKYVDLLLVSETYGDFVNAVGGYHKAYMILKRLVAWGCIDRKEVERLRRNEKAKTLTHRIIEMKRKGMKNRDIAEVLGCSVYYVGTIVWKARKNGILPVPKISRVGENGSN